MPWYGIDRIQTCINRQSESAYRGARNQVSSWDSLRNRIRWDALINHVRWNALRNRVKPSQVGCVQKPSQVGCVQKPSCKAIQKQSEGKAMAKRGQSQGKAKATRRQNEGKAKAKNCTSFGTLLFRSQGSGTVGNTNQTRVVRKVWELEINFQKKGRDQFLSQHLSFGSAM